MRLSTFIESAREEIIAESVQYAGSLPVLGNRAIAILRDHLPLVLDAIVLDLQQSQTRAESIAKSQGYGPLLPGESAAQTHGQLRARSGLSIEQLVAEYRVLRSTVLRLWADAHEPDAHAIEDALRFNEAIDQAVAESVAFHAAETERWRNIFLGVLGHDLRGPLNAILLTTEVLAHEHAAAPFAEQVQSLLRNGHRLEALLDSLLEYNRSRLGVGMVLHRSIADVAQLCRDEVRLLRDALPHAKIALDAMGDTMGPFDASRVREAMANLLSNAAQYGAPGARISIVVRGDEQAVEVCTENESEPIPDDVLQTLFDPLRRHANAATGSKRNLGLGLFIVREIARAHGGDATVSIAGRRVTFRMVLPKMAPAA